MPPDCGRPVRRTGYTLTILRKEGDRRWRLAHDANLPAAEQKPPSQG
jgi:ketosteroid isomerase-like protein